MAPQAKEFQVRGANCLAYNSEAKLRRINYVAQMLLFSHGDIKYANYIWSQIIIPMDIYIYENLHSLYMIVNDIEYLPSLITFESEQELISNMNPFLYATNDLLSI